ncbi:U3 small nucleolar RNA-associated protein 15 homolog [Drosophila ficusphila]|uniref:U3 small nucleolar RNA-associated protein 15 homolog n=1 Tax=Drosophila ficusphila TaxID=30025 RepID=UPI0007E8709C|nr:U3 small nucleolar RNA-associated protein 15 homolog [Drosophila ficusphila]XP_017045980.1 U3 small nucleolar RNA-associated protein 15 homolog [Drosophila ficusphila]
MQSTFFPLNTRRFKQQAQEATPDTVYWDKLAKPELLKEHNTIDYVDISPSDPDNFVLTCSVRVQIYSLVTKLVVKNLSRFQKTAYGATFRQDGRLLAAGDEEGHVKLFDTTSRNILRLYKGHTAPVHRTFFTSDKLQLASFSDDKTVRLWDVANEKVVQTYGDSHTDYIRAGAMHPQTSHMFISGGYDGKINLYDTRAETAVQRTVDHGAPVESLLFLPSGSIFISAGGSQVRVWDMISGCRLLTMMSQHHKTVTCLRLGSDGKRLFSGGLDRHVKIYDVSTYKTVHTLTYPNAVVSLAVASKDQAVVAGMVDGLVSIRRMLVDNKPSNLKKIRAERSRKVYKEMIKPNNTQDVDHIIKERVKGTGLKTFDVHLRSFNHKKALDDVMVPQKMEKQPELVVAVITDLLHRRSLDKALTDRPDKVLIKFINFVCLHLGEIKFMRPLMMAASTVLDVFERQLVVYSHQLMEALERLSAAFQTEIKLTAELSRLKGAMDMLIGVSMENGEVAQKPTYAVVKPAKMQPSSAAKKYVVSVD